MIIKWTTPTVTFTFKSISSSDIVVAYLTIKQNDATVIEKDITTAEITTGKISWTLSQEESGALQTGVSAIISCSWKLSSGKRGESDQLVERIGEPGKSGVI